MAKKPQRQSGSEPQEPPFDSGSDSKPDPDGAKKPRSKSSALDPVTSTKRRFDEKKKLTEDPKKAQNQRVWCDEDEIVILKGLIEYSAKTNADPFADFKAFHDLIKKDLQRKEYIKTQFSDKVRRLYTKYEKNRIKETSCKEMTFHKSHEQEIYELSKTVWGSRNGVEKVGSPKPKAAATKRTFVSDRAKDAAKRVKTEVFENGKGDAGEKERTELRMEEMKIYLRLLEVKSAQSMFVIEHLKSEWI